MIGSIGQIKDVEIVGPLTSFGDFRTAELSPIFQGSFEYTVSNTDLLTTTVTAGGTVTQASGMGVVATSTTTGSDAKLQSKRHARYKSGLGGLLRFTALFTSGLAGTEQYVGIVDEAGSSQTFKNGYTIGYTGTTFGIQRWQNDTLSLIDRADWNDPLDGSGPSQINLDLTKLNVFAIGYQYLGAGAIVFLVEDPSTGLFTQFHIIEYANSAIEPSTHNPNYYFTMWADNKATTSNIILKSSSYAYFVEGKTRFIELHQPINSSGLKEKTSVTTEVAIFTIRNKSTYQSKTNFIDISILLAAASIEASSANNLGSARLVQNATLGGTPSYADINTANSVVDIDVAGTTVSGGKELSTVPLAGKNDRSSMDISNFHFILPPGDTLTLAGISANSATIDGLLLWRELF